MKKCFECSNEFNLHMHHVVPKSKGGVKFIDLCESCHKKVHGGGIGSGYLTRLGLIKKQRYEMALIYIYRKIEFKNFQEISGIINQLLGMEYSAKSIKSMNNRMMSVNESDLLAIIQDLLPKRIK